jgi:hypothetical protein
VLLLAQVWIHWKFNWFFLPNPIFAIYLNFQQQNPLQNNNLHTLALKIMKYILLNLNLLRAFKQYQERLQIPMQFSISILFCFHWRNDSTINNFHIITSNNLKQVGLRVHPYSSKAFLKYQECSMKQRDLGDLNVTKQSKQPCFIDRYEEHVILVRCWIKCLC